MARFFHYGPSISEQMGKVVRLWTGRRFTRLWTVRKRTPLIGYVAPSIKEYSFMDRVRL